VDVARRISNSLAETKTIIRFLFSQMKTSAEPNITICNFAETNADTVRHAVESLALVWSGLPAFTGMRNA
jgi:hypothetical protein